VIQYSLVCENSHEFEAWFKSSAAYGEQIQLGVVTCPICAVPKVTKALMAPSLGSKSNRRENGEQGSFTKNPLAQETPGQALQNGESKDKSLTLSSGHPDQVKLQKIMRELREKITAEADYVGKDFAVEARKIHRDESDARAIYGEATRDETASLIEDGVGIFPLPTLPEKQN